ncbi:hypothetical protein SSZBM1_93 [Synechococcus phage S-SZBM1]|uniref:Uncharacterized protein n=1 Tax=Synechococcus phage S-SZBM1 TaxID=2926475 RepID=A0AC61TSJ6_9CAUD|nr:hypothetical protein PP650_gp183 [Synechococcus phage S-SZBM1]UNH61210.1 hypothetical protein SSZBM1_93 [Synechococcus phage S-SZBM1]
MIPNNNDKLAEIVRDTWPNLFRPPHDYKPPSTYRKNTKENK